MTRVDLVRLAWCLPDSRIGKVRRRCWTGEGEFDQPASHHAAALCEVSCRHVRRRPHQEERLSERFVDNLLPCCLLYLRSLPESVAPCKIPNNSRGLAPYI